MFLSEEGTSPLFLSQLLSCWFYLLFLGLHTKTWRQSELCAPIELDASCDALVFLAAAGHSPSGMKSVGVDKPIFY